MPGYEVAYSEDVAVPDFERVAADYCQRGFDMVFAHTFEYQDPAVKMAPDYPDCHIVVHGGWETAPNVASLTVWTHEGAYLVGMLAGLLTESNKVGIIGGFEYAPTQKTQHEGFKAGVKAVNPDCEIMETWSGTWYDVSIGYEAAIAQIDAGADFIAISLSGPGFGAIEAAKERDVLAAGAFVDMNELAPDNVVTSVLWKLKDPILKLAERIKDGTFEGKVYEFTMDDGSCDIAPYHGFEDKIPQEVKDRVAKARQAIIEGTLVVPFVKE